jgi:N-acyl-D-amino-acid deacylase
VISLERAVAQASAVAANDVLAYDRGRLSEGLAADIVIFDEVEIEDKATFAKPHELSVGMKHVIVNGELVYENGKMTARRPGRVLRGPGYRPEQSPAAIVTGSHDPLLEKYDEQMRQFMKEHRMPGAALAVTDQGRLVFAKGYGYADIATREKVTSKSLFRIASISKPITAVAILQLIEQGKLTLDSKVFEILDYEEVIQAAKEFDARQREITIRHLLEHRAGWDREKSFDAMFQSVRFAKETGGTPPAAPDTVIRAMLNQKLDFDPGERYAYSNYGYCLLGRVIEKLSGQTYEDYVKAHVLSPIGVHAMRIGRTHLADRSPGEVRYYDTGRGPSVFAADLDQLVPWPYGVWYLEAMDSHGAWIASAEDLARFACALDDPQRSPLLKPESMAAMHARPPGLAGHSRGGKPKSQFYSLGWQNRELGDGRVDRSHSGSLAGTATILIRRHDGRNLVVLFNARSSPTLSHLGSGIIGPLDAVTNAIEKWPTIDLFAEVAAGN